MRPPLKPRNQAKECRRVRVRQRALQKPRLRGFSFRIDLQVPERGAGMEPFMDPSRRKLAPESRVARPLAAQRRGLRFMAGARYDPIRTRASLWNRWWNGLHSSASVHGEQSRRGSIAVSHGRAAADRDEPPDVRQYFGPARLLDGWQCPTPFTASDGRREAPGESTLAQATDRLPASSVVVSRRVCAATESAETPAVLQRPSHRVAGRRCPRRRLLSLRR